MLLSNNRACQRSEEAVIDDGRRPPQPAATRLAASPPSALCSRRLEVGVHCGALYPSLLPLHLSPTSSNPRLTSPTTAPPLLRRFLSVSSVEGYSASLPATSTASLCLISQVLLQRPSQQSATQLAPITFAAHSQRLLSNHDPRCSLPTESEDVSLQPLFSRLPLSNHVEGFMVNTLISVTINIMLLFVIPGIYIVLI
ncbi:hypothetical protein BHM03_00048130 [Ensete ventricosum]|nr:hypothetical protein BHM03_00048130 [Ensete ventricosum]